MGLLEHLKKSRITCPHCQAGFDVGPDLKAITDSASTLLSNITKFIDGPQDEDDEDDPFIEPVMSIAENLDVSPTRARALLAEALEDESVMNTVLDFLYWEENHEN